MALGISPSPWRSAATYALIWQHPPEVSGVGKTYVKVAGASPSVLGPVTSHTVDLGPSAPQGATAVAVWLEDNVQNVDPNNAAVVELRHDSVVPTIAASAPPKAAAAPIAVSFTATEPGAGGQAPTASGVKKTTLWHRTIPAEATCATSPGPWTKGPESIGPGEGGASFSGAFPFTPPADARYCFHVQAEDVAGNKTPDPAATTAAHGETLYDGTPPILSALRVADLSAKQASLAFAGDEPATARVEWGLTSALGNAIPLPEAIAFTADLPGLPSAALIYYKVTLTNRVGGTSASAVQTFSTPLDLAVAASIDSVIYPDQPIVIRLDNPSVSQAAYSIGGSAGPIPVSGSFSLFPPAVPGPATLSITIDGAVYSRAFIVDDPSRNYRVVRKVVGPGGEESSSAVSKILAVPGQPAATGAAPLASDRSQLFLGYLAGIDPMAPGPIADLAAVPGPGRGQVTLSWKAVGDDAGVGRAMVYELRRSASPILTEADFKNATPTSLPVYPAQAGTSQSAVVSGLPDGAQLHFALKALDEVRNAGPLGRVAAAATLAFTASAETVGGAPAFELLSSVAGITVRRVESPGTLPVLRAAAQGFTLGGPLFEVLSPINPLPAPGALTLRYDPAAVGAAEALLKIYRFDAGAGSWELLADSRLEPDRDLVTATVGRFSYITLLAPDVEAPTTELLVNSGGRYLSPDGQTFLSAASRLSLSARDPPVGALPGTGVSRTEYRLDAGAFAAYDAPFTLPEGLRRLEYRSFDLAANTETLRSAVLRLDAAAPRFALSSPEPALDAAGVFTLLSTRAADGGLPRLVVSVTDALSATGAGPGAGVALASVSLDGAPYAAFAGSVTLLGSVTLPGSVTLRLTPGRHLLRVSAEDNVGNAVAGAELAVAAGDLAPPRVALKIGAPRVGEFVAAGTVLSWTAEDDLLSPGDALGTGAAFLSVLADGVPLATARREPARGAALIATATLAGLADGTHALSWSAHDAFGNVVLGTAALVLDARGPRFTSINPAAGAFTSAAAVGVEFADAGVGVSSASVALAVDGLAKAVVATTAAARAEAALAEGHHAALWTVADLLGNAASTATAFAVDRTPPLVNLVSPLGGERFVAGAGTVAVAFAVSDAISTSSAEAALAQLTDRGSPRGARPALVAVSSGAALDPLALDDGLWELRVSAVDAAGNSTQAVSGPFEVIHDLRPPRTALTAGTPLALVAGASVVARGTALTLASIDDLVSVGDALGLGVAAQQVSVDGIIRATFTTSISTFSLATEADGWHQVAYFATDVLGNVEAARVSTFGIDDTAPETSLAALGGRQAAGLDSVTFYASSGTYFALSAVDRVVNGVATGVDFTRWRDNGGTFAAYLSPFSLSEGPHLLAYQSQDRLGKLEVLRNTTALIDATAPGTTLVVIGGRQYAGPDGSTFYASSDTRLALPATDPVSNEVASGLAFTRWQDNAGPYRTYTAAFILAEGAHALGYQSQDNVQNLEVPRTTNVWVDATPPVSTFAFGTPYFKADESTNYLTPATPVSFTAVDPALPTGQAGSGVNRIEVAIDSGSFVTYTAPLKFPEGRHTVQFRSFDNVANVEATKTLYVQSDATPPLTTLAVQGGRQYPAGPASFYASSATLLGLPAFDPVTNGVASSLAVTRWQDNGGTFRTYTAPFGLAEGSHALGYQSQDNVQNLEVLRSTAVLIDATAPQTTLAVMGGRRYPGPDASTFYASSDTQLTLPATDPTSNGVASGLAFTRWQDNAGPYRTYNAALSLGEGAHALGYQSQDNVQNPEVLRTTNVWVDATPPASAFAFGTPYFKAADGTNYFTPATLLTFMAADPALSTGQAGSGVNRIEVSVDGGSFVTYTAALKFPEGRHAIQFRSFDNVANVEATKTLYIQSDATPPLTTLAVQGGRQYPAGPTSFYASSATLLGLPAVDPVANGVASGLAFTRWQDNGGAFQTYASPFGLAEGRHALGYQSQDNVQNLEVLRSTAVLIDHTAPETTLAVMGGRQHPGPDASTFYASSDSRLALPATDPISNGVASGLASTRWQDNGAAFQSYIVALSLAEGAHLLSYQSQDNVQNLEVPRTTNVWVDATAPVTTLAFGTPYFKTPDGTNYVTPAAPLSFTAVDPVLPTGQAGSGVNRIEVSVDGGSFVTYTAPLKFPEGRHIVQYRSLDNVANVETARTLHLQSDATPPLTVLAIQGGRQHPGPDGSTFYTSSDTRLGLPATDPISQGVASGLAFTRWRDNSGAFQTFTSAFGFAEGAHALGYQSQDNVQNLEVPRTTNVWVDATPPASAFAFGAPYFKSADGTNYLTPATPLTFMVADPALPTGQAGSGVSRIEVAVDGGSFVTYTAALKFPEGRHAIQFRSIDNVANVEATRTLYVQSDATPPLTTLAVQGGHQYPASPASFYASSATLLGLPAFDPVTNGVASGLSFTRWQDNGGTFQTYASPFGLAEGSHALGYQSRDNVQNLEVLRSTTVLIDATAPETTLAIVGGRQYPGPDGSTFYASSDTRLALPGVDPVSNGVTSGLAFTRWRDNSGAFQTFTSGFGLAEGAHALGYQSQDIVQNQEVLRTANVWVDTTPPASMFAFGTPYFKAADGTNYLTPATPLTFTAADPALPTDQAGSGVNRIEVAIDGGAFAAYTSSLKFAEGRHTVQFRSFDNVANVEATKTLYVQSDVAPPLTTLAVQGGRQHPAGPASFYASSATLLGLPAVDPVANGVASGLAFTRWQDNGGTFETYTALFGLAEGRHALSYQSQDNVQNLEVLKSTTALVDATAPETTLAIVGGRQYPGPDGSTFYASSDTRLGLPVADPLSNGVASGLAFTRWQDNGGAFQTFSAAFSLAEGAHALSYQSQDNVANLEVARTTNAWIDATAPVTTFVFGAPYFKAADGTNYITPATPVSFAALDPALPTGQAGSGVNRIEVSVDGGSFAAYTAPLKFPEGRHTIQFRSFDNVANVEATKTLYVQSDATAPRTSFAAVGGRQFRGPDAATFYASLDTRFNLPAFDPVVNNVASGLAFTRWQDNNGAYQTFSAAFSLAEGAHALSYQSQDNVANLEVAHATNVWIDATPPVTTFALGAPYFKAADGTNYITPATAVSFAATDPALPTGQAGSGVNRIEVAVDGGQFVTYTAPLTFAEGRHTVKYRSLDNVANAEAARTLAIRSDATPPLTALATVGGRQFPGPDSVSFYASLDTRYGLPAADPVAQDVASGLAFTRWQDGSGPFAAYGIPFALPEGVHRLGYQSQDNVENLELLRSTTALVDATAPRTTLAYVGGRQYPGPDANTFYASSDTRLALPAADPVSNGVASGLASTRRQDGSGPYQSYGASFGLAEGAHRVSYQSQDNVANLEVARTTNAWIDATPPVTASAFGAPFYQAPDGTNYVTPAAPLSFTAADPGLPTGQPGSAVNRIEVAVGGGPLFTYTAALKFGEGRHAVLYRAVDNVSNHEGTRTLSLRSDATPPLSSLVIGQPQSQLPNILLVSSRTPFAVAALDPVVQDVASGVKDASYRVLDATPSTAAFQTFTAAFTLGGGAPPPGGADVNKVIEFTSRDNVLNTEVIRSSTVLLDSTPPELALLSPAFCDAGICRVLKGRFPVLGTARELHPRDYQLEYAPGKDAVSGFVRIGSGTVSVTSGTLASWDASGLSGWQTLRLTGADLVLNVSALTLNVWVGDPAALMALGNHDTFNLPSAVAVGTGGAIYVADRNNDRIAVFSSAGALLAAFGSEDEEHGEHDSTGTLRLNKPSGVAVDGAGNIYVADTGHDRVLKLAPTGALVWAAGRRPPAAGPGKGPGEFDKPLGVAVDAAGRVYVSDSGNHRVQTLAPDGTYLAQFALPPVEDDDEREDDGPELKLGKPAGLALDAAGNVYVADPKGHRALKFGPAGGLFLTIPIAGREKDEPGRPAGVAVSPSGECILVSDQKGGVILKFDRTGAQNLAFGTKDEDDDDDQGAAFLDFNKPSGLALDAAGNLYVADRNGGRIVKLGLPDGRAALVVPPPKADDHVARGVVDHEGGGRVARKDGAAVLIPPKALPEDLRVTVASRPREAEARHGAAQGLTPASPAVEYGPEGTRFAQPVTLVIPYTPALAAAAAAAAQDLKVAYWNEKKREWEPLPSTVDPAKGTVSAQTTHFSLYQVMAAAQSAAAPAAAGPDAGFQLRSVYVFPNPAVGGQRPVLHVAVGVADRVTFRIYDISGQQVHEAMVEGAPQVVDDGSGPQFAYELPWDGHIPSGVYLYTVVAEKNGQGAIRKAGKFSVVR